MKKYYVAIDMEGVACVAGAPFQTLSASKDCSFAAREALNEANACARALFDSGADEVVLWDNHGGGVNFDYSLADPRCRIAFGCGFGERFPALDESWSGVLFIGYHAREGTPNAVLAHSYSSVTYQYMKVNGKELGEAEIDAACAGAFGVKTLFAASDEAGAAQMKESMPWIETVAVKKGWGRTAAISLSPAEAQRQIYEATLRAVRREVEMAAYTLPQPLEMEIRYQRADMARDARLYDRFGQPFAFKDAFTRTGELNRIADFFKL